MEHVGSYHRGTGGVAALRICLSGDVRTSDSAQEGAGT